MDSNPLLVFPRPVSSETPAALPRPQNSRLRIPSFQRQQQRVDGLLALISDQFNRRAAALSGSSVGLSPEDVLVLEVSSSVNNLLNAARRIDGLEWLGELIGESIESDEDFFFEGNPETPVPKTIYLAMTNRRALTRLETLWREYKDNEGKSIERNYGAFRDLFEDLIDLRFWNKQDRLRGTLFQENLEMDIESGDGPVRIEAELWYRNSVTERSQAFESLVSRIVADGGKLISQCVIEAISFHGVLFELPREVVIDFLQNGIDIPVIDDSSVQYLTPSGQCVAKIQSSGSFELSTPLLASRVNTGKPLIGLLDGVPLSNHSWLSGRVNVDDPDEYESTSPVHARVHGTAMASLILWGDRSIEQEPLTHQLYVRPIMKPKKNAFEQYTESIPSDLLTVDVVHRAFKRIFEGEAGNPPEAPTIRIINFSIGNEALPFDRVMSAWARMLDYLSWKYNVLILVSAGNYLEELPLQITNDEIESADEETISREVIRSISRSRSQRRILSPSEEINVLTVGALNRDAGGNTPLPPNIINCFPADGFPSPLTRLGHGFKNAVKPDLLMPGGRQLYRAKPGMPSDSAILRIVEAPNHPFGQLVASPGANEVDIKRGAYTTGTSNSTALATNAAAKYMIN